MHIHPGYTYVVVVDVVGENDWQVATQYKNSKSVEQAIKWRRKMVSL